MSDTNHVALVELTDADLDAVSGGLITVALNDVVDVNNNAVGVQVPVAAAIAVLGAAGAGNLFQQTGRPGRQ